MILTKDNLLRFVKEQRYTTPTQVAESFETSTMIASAALSELAKDKLLLISHIKIGSTPYYYDPRQKDCLIELGDKHFSKYEKEVFLLLRQQQVINDASLTIQLRLGIENIKDFAISLEIPFNNKNLKFWVWYLRDIKETEKQIKDALKGNLPKEEPKKTTQMSKPTITQNNSKRNPTVIGQNHSMPGNHGVFQPQLREVETHESKVDFQIDKFLNENYLKTIEKEVHQNGTSYKASVMINEIEIIFDCFYFEKKPKDPDIIKFYSSSQNPKIIFIQNTPKKFFKLAENLENLTVVNI